MEVKIRNRSDLGPKRMALGGFYFRFWRLPKSKPGRLGDWSSAPGAAGGGLGGGSYESMSTRRVGWDDDGGSRLDSQKEFPGQRCGPRAGAPLRLISLDGIRKSAGGRISGLRGPGAHPPPCGGRTRRPPGIPACPGCAQRREHQDPNPGLRRPAVPMPWGPRQAGRVSGACRSRFPFPSSRGLLS